MFSGRNKGKANIGGVFLPATLLCTDIHNVRFFISNPIFAVVLHNFLYTDQILFQLSIGIGIYQYSLKKLSSKRISKVWIDYVFWDMHTRDEFELEFSGLSEPEL